MENLDHDVMSDISLSKEAKASAEEIKVML
jgi:hypothetical protein